VTYTFLLKGRGRIEEAGFLLLKGSYGMGEKKAQSFIKGAAVLTAAGLIAKVIGFIYRAILPRLIGAEGYGLYQLAYPIYTTLLTVSRSGIPVALAKLIAAKMALEERRNAFKIFQVSRKLSIVVGLFFSIVMAILARPLINILEWDTRAYYPVLAISPAIFFVSIMATYRGFFQGLQDMIPTALSQVAEQFVKMLTMLILVFLLLNRGLSIAVAGATFGVVTGAIVGLLILLYIYYRQRKSIWESVNVGAIVNYNSWDIVKDIAYLGVPITLAALVQPLMQLVDATIIPRRLAVAGFSVGTSTALYGYLGMAMTLVNFPSIITISLAVSLVPAISEAFALKKDDLVRRRTETGLRMGILISLPAAMGLFVLAEPITGIIFAYSEAAIALEIVSWGVLFIALQQISSAILQGIGKTSIPAKNLLIGAICNGIINYILTAQPRFGIRGAALGTTIGFAVAAFLNLYHLKKYTDYKFDMKSYFIKPVLAVLIMAIIVRRGFPLMDSFLNILTGHSYSLATIIMIIFAAFIYLFLLLLLNLISYNDLAMLPFVGKRLADILTNLGLVRGNDGK
ncbi:MAG: putative polysaccharide biosynthesis protein, partial [bacterium]